LIHSAQAKQPYDYRLPKITVESFVAGDTSRKMNMSCFLHSLKTRSWLADWDSL